MGLWHTYGSPNLSQKNRPCNNQQQKKKRTCKIVDFAVPADHRIKLKECEKKDKYLDLTWELKKLCNMRVTIVPIEIGSLGTVTKGLLKGLDDWGSWQSSGDHPNDSIIENGQNIEESPGDLRRLAVTQTPMKNHQLTLMWKTLKEKVIIIIIYLFMVYLHHDSIFLLRFALPEDELTTGQ